MVGLIIRPSDLTTERTSPVASEFMVVDNGVTVAKSKISDVVNSGRPVASQAEAEAGTDPNKAMTPLTSRQAINERLTNSSILSTVARTGAYADITGAPPALTDGDKGDVIVSGSGADWTIARRFDTVALALADTTMTYAAGVSQVTAGQIVEAQGFRYAVAASGASDNDIVTAGGVKLYLQLTTASTVPLEALGLILGDSSPSAMATNNAVHAAAVAKAGGAAGAGIQITTPFTAWYYSETWLINKRDTSVIGPSKANSVAKFRPATAIPAVKARHDDGSRISNVVLKGFAIEGAEVGGTSVGNLGLWIDHCHFPTVDLDILRFNGTDHWGVKYTGGNAASSHFSMLGEFDLKIDTCKNGLQIGSNTAGENGPVNFNKYHGRIAATGGTIGVSILKGYQNHILADVELYTTTIDVQSNGNYVNAAIIEQAGTTGINVGAAVKEFGVIGSYYGSLIKHEANWPVSIDGYNGLTAWRSVDGSGENLILNGDFYDGANGLGSWSDSQMFWTGNKWRYRNLGATSPSGPLVFVPGAFKANTWYSLVFEAWLETGASVSSAALRLRVNGTTDPGYTTGTGESLLQTEAALNINGGTTNQATVPSSAIPNDGVRRKFVKRFFTGSNTGFPSTLELYSPTAAFTGGYLNVEWVAVYEGTVPPNFQLSRQDIAHRKTGSLQYSVANTLPTYTTSFTVNDHGGSFYVDSSGGNVVVTLPSAKVAGRGARVFVKKLASANAVTVTAAASQNIDGASTAPISTQWGKVTLESNGLDRWYVVAS